MPQTRATGAAQFFHVDLQQIRPVGMSEYNYAMVITDDRSINDLSLILDTCLIMTLRFDIFPRSFHTWTLFGAFLTSPRCLTIPCESSPALALTLSTIHRLGKDQNVKRAKQRTALFRTSKSQQSQKNPLCPFLSPSRWLGGAQAPLGHLPVHDVHRQPATSRISSKQSKIS